MSFFRTGESDLKSLELRLLQFRWITWPLSVVCSVALHVGESAANLKETVAISFDHFANLNVRILRCPCSCKAPLFCGRFFRIPFRFADDQPPKGHSFVDVKQVFKVFGHRQDTSSGDVEAQSVRTT